jgi:hypothetical protein
VNHDHTHTLAYGVLSRTNDSLRITYVRHTDSSRDVIQVLWPDHPTTCTPTQFGELVGATALIMAHAGTELRRIQQGRRGGRWFRRAISNPPTSVWYASTAATRSPCSSSGRPISARLSGPSAGDGPHRLANTSHGCAHGPFPGGCSRHRSDVR